MKKLIAALALGMLIGSATTALAAPDVVEATVAKFKFLVNGEEREVKTEQLVVMGTTYLPVREVANMLGHDVTFRSDSQTIELTADNADKSTTITKKGDDKMTTTEKKLPIDSDVWLRLSDPVAFEKYGIQYIARVTGEAIIRKGDLEFTIPARDTQTGDTRSYDGYTFRVTIVSGMVFYSIEDLQAAGFID